MAVAQGWPIRADHCFMRVCLDTAVGQAWPAVIPTPAYRHASNHQLAAAIAIAERMVAAPDSLAALNENSLRLRAAWRAAGSPKIDKTAL